MDLLRKVSNYALDMSNGGGDVFLKGCKCWKMETKLIATFTWYFIKHESRGVNF
jgi:hypothetical protein